MQINSQSAKRRYAGSPAASPKRLRSAARQSPREADSGIGTSTSPPEVSTSTDFQFDDRMFSMMERLPLPPICFVDPSLMMPNEIDMSLIHQDLNQPAGPPLSAVLTLPETPLNPLVTAPGGREYEILDYLSLQDCADFFAQTQVLLTPGQTRISENQRYTIRLVRNLDDHQFAVIKEARSPMLNSTLIANVTHQCRLADLNPKIVPRPIDFVFIDSPEGPCAAVIMPFLPGVTLARVIQTIDAHPEMACSHLTSRKIDIALALNAAVSEINLNSDGIVGHGNLTAENVLMDPSTSPIQIKLINGIPGHPVHEDWLTSQILIQRLLS